MTEATLCACHPPATRVLTPLLTKMPIDKVMGMGVNGYGSRECFLGAGELSGSVGWRSSLGSSYGPTNHLRPLWPLVPP